MHFADIMLSGHKARRTGAAARTFNSSGVGAEVGRRTGQGPWASGSTSFLCASAVAL